MEELCKIKETNEVKSKAKIANMKEALLKVGTLQERANQNNTRQCDLIGELLNQVEILKRKLKESQANVASQNK